MRRIERNRERNSVREMNNIFIHPHRHRNHHYTPHIAIEGIILFCFLVRIYVIYFYFIFSISLSIFHIVHAYVYRVWVCIHVNIYWRNAFDLSFSPTLQKYWLTLRSKLRFLALLIFGKTSYEWMINKWRIYNR